MAHGLRASATLIMQLQTTEPRFDVSEDAGRRMSAHLNPVWQTSDVLQALFTKACEITICDLTPSSYNMLS